MFIRREKFMSKIPLSERYDEKVIEEAEERRRRLDYDQIHVGLNNNRRVDMILRLLFQTHQNYYFGLFESSAILCGALLEQSLVCLLQEEVELNGMITYKNYSQLFEAKDVDEISSLPLIVQVKTAAYHGIIPREKQKLADELRLIRNLLMHDLLPPFEKGKFSYDSRLRTDFKGGGSFEKEISIRIEEVEDHCLYDNSEEIWAYYTLTRTRLLMNDIFKERVKRHPPKV